MDKKLELSEPEKEEMQQLLFELERVVHDTPLPNTYYGWVDDLDNVMDVLKKKYPVYYDRLYDLVLELQRLSKEHIGDIENEEISVTISHSSEAYFRQMAYVVSEIRSLKTFIL